MGMKTTPADAQVYATFALGFLSGLAVYWFFANVGV